MLNSTISSVLPDTQGKEYGFSHLIFFSSILLGGVHVVSSLIKAFTSTLRKIPGPWIARLTPWHRVWLFCSGNAPIEDLKLHQAYGPIVRTGPNTVSISDVTAIPIIYGITSHFTKSRFYTTLTPTYKGTDLPGLFATSDPAKHKALKKPVAAKYSMTSILSLEVFADECTAIFIDSMVKHEGEIVDLSTWLQWYAFDVIGGITFARRFGFLEEETDVKEMIASIDFGITYAGIAGLVPWLHPFLLGNKTLLKVLDLLFSVGSKDPARVMSDMADRCILEYDDREKEGKVCERPDFLRWLRIEKQKGSALTDNDIMSHILTNLFAGSDTTAISLRTVLYMVIRKPEIYLKLQREIDEADSQGRLSKFVTYGESLKLPYLQAIIKESLRVHPAVQYPMERVVPPEGFDIGGFHLPPGTIVGMNPYVVHQDPGVFGEDAAEFRPERWLESTPEKLTQMERGFMTFGYGSRTCIGKNISIMEMGKFVPQILRYFDIEWASESPEWTTKTYWFAKQSGLNVAFRRRRAATA